MRIIAFLLVLFLGLGFGAVCADQGESLQVGNEAEIQGRLDEMEIASLKMRIQDLERKVAWIEKENRFQEEKLRQLDQYVDDLKRR